MENKELIKQIVKEKYSQMALQENKASKNPCCTPECCSPDLNNIMNENYSKLYGYNPDADLGLGCGLPTQFAKIKNGDTVIDLGSGAGNDCFVARYETGKSGRVIGIDFSKDMIIKANEKIEKNFLIKNNHGLIEMFCGTGKTRVLFYQCTKDSNLCVVVFPSLPLMNQFKDDYINQFYNMISNKKILAVCSDKEFSDEKILSTTDEIEIIIYNFSITNNYLFSR